MLSGQEQEAKSDYAYDDICTDTDTDLLQHHLESLLSSDMPVMLSQPALKKHNTGPKGVLQDYYAYERQQKLVQEQETKRLLEDIKKRAMLLTLEQSYLENQDEQDGHDEAEKERIKAERKKYRQQELADSRISQKLEIKVKSSERPRFGHLDILHSALEFSDLIDCPSHANTLILIHLYLPNSTLGNGHRYNRILSSLAQKYTLAHFLRANVRLIDQDFDVEAGLPAILCYFNGELVGNLVRFDEYFSFECDGDDGMDVDLEKEVERVLIELGGLDPQRDGDDCYD